MAVRFFERPNVSYPPDLYFICCESAGSQRHVQGFCYANVETFSVLLRFLFIPQAYSSPWATGDLRLQERFTPQKIPVKDTAKLEKLSVPEFLNLIYTTCSCAVHVVADGAHKRHP